MGGGNDTIRTVSRGIAAQRALAHSDSIVAKPEHRVRGTLNVKALKIATYATGGIAGAVGRACAASPWATSTKSYGFGLKRAIQDYGESYRNMTDKKSAGGSGARLESWSTSNLNPLTWPFHLVSHRLNANYRNTTLAHVYNHAMRSQGAEDTEVINTIDPASLEHRRDKAATLLEETNAELQLSDDQVGTALHSNRNSTRMLATAYADHADLTKEYEFRRAIDDMDAKREIPTAGDAMDLYYRAQEISVEDSDTYIGNLVELRAATKELLPDMQRIELLRAQIEALEETDQNLATPGNAEAAETLREAKKELAQLEARELHLSSNAYTDFRYQVDTAARAADDSLLLGFSGFPSWVEQKTAHAGGRVFPHPESYSDTDDYQMRKNEFYREQLSEFDDDDNAPDLE